MPVSITFLGHAAFMLRSGDHTLLIDPFLTGNPAATVSADDIKCNHLALTHAHDDHIGDSVAILKRTGAAAYAAFELAEYLTEQGAENVSPGNPGGRINTEFGFIAFTQAFHSSSYQGRYMGMPCGLVIEMNGTTIYHAGDTGLFSDMRLIGELYRPDVAILPIGDRFTMGPAHAARAAEMIAPRTVIPCHYNTWPPIEQDPKSMKLPAGMRLQVMDANDEYVVD